MAVLIRAVLMLLVLVGLPAAWVYYGPLPSNAQRLVDRVVEVAKSAMGVAPQTQLAEGGISAPRYDYAAAAPPASPTSPQVEPLLERLRQLGVAEYTLEKWGSADQLYRFRCKMPLVAQNEEITRQFEAVADDPFASIEQVVGEVASWQTARLGQQQLH